MSNVNILNLEVAINLDGTEWVPLVQGLGIDANTKRAQVSQINNVALDDISTTQGAVLYRGASAWTALDPGTNGQVLTTGGDAANPSWTTNGAGTVTSVAMTVPSFLSVSGSPITSNGTLAVSLATQSANTIFAGPTTDSAATPTFRALVAADLPGTVLVWGS